jgi:hypothetical protein
LYLADTRDAWLLQSDGSYLPVTPEPTVKGKATAKGKASAGHSAQAVLMARYGRKG